MIVDRRDQPVGISAEAVALAWLRQENAPSGALVVMGQEVSPRGRHGRLWAIEPERTLALAVVIRPDLLDTMADALWFVASLATVDAIAEVGGGAGTPRWPGSITSEVDDREMAMLHVAAQLGPKAVRSAVITVRVDLEVADVALRDRVALTEAIQSGLMERLGRLQTSPEEIASEFAERSGLVEQPVKLTLLPTGSLRGVVQGFDPTGALRLGSTAEVNERIPLDSIRELTVVDRS